MNSWDSTRTLVLKEIYILSKKFKGKVGTSKFEAEKRVDRVYSSSVHFCGGFRVAMEFGGYIQRYDSRMMKF